MLFVILIFLNVFLKRRLLSLFALLEDHHCTSSYQKSTSVKKLDAMSGRFKTITRIVQIKSETHFRQTQLKQKIKILVLMTLR